MESPTALTVDLDDPPAFLRPGALNGEQQELKDLLLRQARERQEPAPPPAPRLAGPPAPVTAPTRPKRARTSPARQDPPPTVPAPPAAVFDRAALYRPAAGERAPAPYEMPGGGVVYPHPLSGGERKYVNTQVARHLQRLYQGRDAPRTEDEARLRELEVALDTEILGDIWHAVVCCRVGPALEDPRVFEDEDAEAFYVNPGWEEAAQSLAAQSRAHAAGKTEAGLLRESLRGFFAATRSMLTSCAAQLATGSSAATDLPSRAAAVQATLTSCATSLQRLTPPAGVTSESLRVVAGELAPCRP